MTKISIDRNTLTPKLYRTNSSFKGSSPVSVFGNGNGFNPSSTSDSGSPLYLAIGFNTGNSKYLSLSSVIFGAADNSLLYQFIADLYSDVSGLPGVLLAQSDKRLFSNISKKLEFSFNNYFLEPNTNYWIGLQQHGFWYYNSPNTSASDLQSLNSSGYIFNNLARKFPSSQPWTTYAGALGPRLTCVINAGIKTDQLFTNGYFSTQLTNCQVKNNVATITNNFSVPAVIDAGGGVDDDIIINGQVYQPGQFLLFFIGANCAGMSSGPNNGAHAWSYRKILQPSESVVFGARDNGIGTGSLYGWWTLKTLN